MSSSALARAQEKLAKYRNDPVGFCREFLEFEPHPGQIRWLLGSNRTENAIVTGNRWGKSTIAAAKRIWKATYRKGWTPEMRAKYAQSKQPYRSVMLGPTADQARLSWDKARAMLSGRKASWLVKGEPKETPFPTITLVTGATIGARSTADKAKRLLGQDYDDANWDEVALEGGTSFKTILDNVLRMRMVDRGGSIDYTSTGQGRNQFGLYFLEGLAKKNDLYTQTGTSYENPNINQIALANAAGKMSDLKRRQNVLGDIVEGGDSFFPGIDLDAAVDRDLDVHVLIRDEEEREAHAIVYVDGLEWVARYPTHRYIHGWDIAMESDWSVGTTWDITMQPHVMVEFERFQRLGWEHLYSRQRVRHSKYAYSETWIDATGVGAPVLEELSDIQAQGVIFSDNQTRTGKKSEMLTFVQSMLSQRELRVPLIRAWLEEMQWYVREDKGLLKDCVMSTAVAGEGIRNAGGEFYFSET